MTRLVPLLPGRDKVVAEAVGEHRAQGLHTEHAARAESLKLVPEFRGHVFKKTDHILTPVSFHLF